MRIEKFNEHHLSACSKMYVDTFNGEPWYDKWTQQTAYDRLNEIFMTPGFTGVVVYKNDELLGAIFGHLETWCEGYMYNLKEMFVRHDLKGQGIGSYLFKGLEEELSNHHVDSLILMTSRGDLTERFYLNNGCVTEEDMIIMFKSYD